MERRDKGQDIVLVASEPLTFERADWVTVPSNCTHLKLFCSDNSDIDYKWTDCVVASNYRYGILVWSELTIDEYHNADPLHVRRSGFAASKGQSSVIAVH
jgi:glutamine amidotransferase